MTETLKPCHKCGAPCSVQVFPNATLWVCIHNKKLEGGCRSDTAYLSAEDWNTRAPDDVAQIVAWQPIETWPGTDEAYAFVCRAGNVVPFVACYDANGDEWTSWNGHYERGGKQLIPTHWMPLLVPPAERGDWKDKDDG